MNGRAQTVCFATQDVINNAMNVNSLTIDEMKNKKWTQAQKIEQIERATTKLYLMVSQLSKEVQKLKDVQNPE